VTDPYPILDANAWPSPEIETLGTKSKVWLSSPDGHRWLYKHPRPGTGDDWAEKVAAELAALIDVPHAVVELGLRGDVRGSLSLDFTREAGIRKWRLAPGNELFSQIDPSYPKDQFRGVRQHFLDRILDVLIQSGARQVALLDGSAQHAPEVYCGYLILDAWIGNQDRHHENWGLLFPTDASNLLGTVLAPSYDHASCLGQGLTDEAREKRLSSLDRGYALDGWVLKARSAIFADETAKKPMLLLEAVERARLRYPSGTRYWLDKLNGLAPDAWRSVIERLPDGVASSAARRFAVRMLDQNRANLLRLRIP